MSAGLAACVPTRFSRFIGVSRYRRQHYETRVSSGVSSSQTLRRRRLFESSAPTYTDVGEGCLRLFAAWIRSEQPRPLGDL
jgi:hypothetical protein